MASAPGAAATNECWHRGGEVAGRNRRDGGRRSKCQARLCEEINGGEEYLAKSEGALKYDLLNMENQRNKTTVGISIIWAKALSASRRKWRQNISKRNAASKKRAGVWHCGVSRRRHNRKYRRRNGAAKAGAA